MLNSISYSNRSAFFVTLALALLFLTLSPTAFALPTFSGALGSPNLELGQPGNGPSLSGGSSLPGNHHHDDEWDDSDGGHDGDHDGGHDGDHGEDGDDNSAPVPEPTTALLMSLGLAGVSYLKRRRK